MSFMTTLPADIAATAGELVGLGATVTAAHSAAAGPLAAVVPPAPEPTSILAAMSHQTHHGIYQAAAGVADAIHALFASTMGVSAASYTATEVAGALTML